MGEVKSVKVDNWGVFFLQKLQNFFNKTDYCDLTLQFRDNSQLKVHRLVLSACTDYFNVLEQTCEIVDDALIMPNEFQADVVVPIVNFMYTGTLEFELKMYGKLLRTAKEMNMTVLLKLLEAHRRTMENVNRAHRPPSPKGIRRSRGPIQISPQRSVSTIPQRNTAVQVQQLRSASANTGVAQRSQNTSVLRTNAAVGQNSRGDFENTQQQTKQEQPTSPFEQLRKGYNNNKRPANVIIPSPPAKKPNLEDVKEFAEQQRMRKQIAAEYGEDQEYEGMMDDDIHADDDDDETPQPPLQPSTSKQVDTTIQTTRVEHGGATIIFKQESPDQQPTIIVKDSSSTKLNHAKIIAEVLRQYPHLMKGQKNIKLKIMPNTPQAASATTAATQAQKVVKKETVEAARPPSPQKRMQPPTRSILASGTKPAISSPTQTIQQKMAPPVQKSIGSQVLQPLPASAAAAAASAVQKRRIDSKTMHALIALGAENTTGPWLCLRCGVNNRPISIPSYRGFRRHLINTHKEAIDPALCEYCGWRSEDERDLHYHMRVEHKVASSAYTFPECTICNEIFSKYELLNAHLEEVHANSKQQCIYCNRFFAKELQLYTHMKTQHKAQALEDGIIDETDEEYVGDGGSQDEEDAAFKKDSKVKILSDISLPNANSLVSLESAQTIAKTESEVTNVEEILQTTSESEIKFVGPDGNEVQLTDEQRKEILSQLNQQEHGGVVMVLNETSGNEEQEQEPEQEEQQLVKAGTDSADVKSAVGTEEPLIEEVLNEEGEVVASPVAEELDDSQIYNELNAHAAADENKKSASGQLDESKESVDNLEWAENIISEHERETSSSSNAVKPKKPNLSDKLKELTCDWSEDENEDKQVESGKTKANPKKTEKDSKFDTKMDKPAEPQEGSKAEEKTERTEVKTDAATSNAVQEKDEEEEDDIDLALQNLHKETSPEKELERVQKGESNTKTVNSANTVDTIEKIESVVDELTKDTEIKDEPTDESKHPEEFMEISPAKSLIEDFEEKNTTEKTSEPVGDGEGDDSQMERDNIKRTLLDDLIAEVDNVKTEELDEISTKKDKAATIGATTEIETESKTPEKPTEATDTKTEATIDVAVTDVKVNDGGKIAEEAAVATDKNEPAPTSEELNPTTSGAASGKTAGTDKVKTLINDWGADEQDNNVNKAKK